jgi:hypothetical protein
MQGSEEMKTTDKEVIEAVSVFKKLIDEGKVVFIHVGGGTYRVDRVEIFQEGVIFAGWEIHNGQNE